MAGGLGKLAGAGTVGEQLLIWDVLGESVSAALSPELQLLTRIVNKLLPSTPLSPAQLADMVVKGHVDEAAATEYAKESGIAPPDFKRMVDDAGEPPGLVFLLEAFRRGYIPQSGSGPESVSLEQGIRESRLHPKWTNVVEQMGLQPFGVSDAVDAVVESQIPYATGEHYAYLNGISAADFRILVNTRGNPPSPSELATLLKRGLIPLEGTGPDAISFQQGIFEGASKDKWWEYYAKLADYIPPPRTVVALVSEGSVSDEQALTWFEQGGLTADTAKIYLNNAKQKRLSSHHATISTELRTVARRGFANGQLNETQFTELLAQAGLPQESIDQEVAAARLDKQLGRHVWTLSQIKQQRQHGLIDDAQARQRLQALGWPDDDITTQLAEWTAEASAGRSGLTETRILAYLVGGVLTPTEAYDKLLELGIKSDNALFLVQNPRTVPAVKPHGSTTADIIAAYKDGILNLEQTRQKLIDTGDTADAADLKLQVAHYTLNRGPKPKLAHKNLTEAQILEALKLGFAADTWALRELVTLGYSDADASLLVAMEETKATNQAPLTWAVLT